MSKLKDFLRNKINKLLGTNDIEIAKRRIATDTSANYVIERMLNSTICKTSDEVIMTALKVAPLEGLKLEFGVYTGHTINLIAQHVDRIYGFDSFEGLPENWHGEIQKGHFSVANLPKVASNVVLKIGWFDETLPLFLEEIEQTDTIALLHIDCDLYSSTKTVFDNVGPLLKIGSVIIFNEYFNYPGWQKGEFKAFQEFIKNFEFNYEYLCYNKNHEQVAIRICN